MKITGRLNKLEEDMHPQRVVFVWQNHDETDDVAIARWCAAHPSEPNPDNVYLIRWGSPQ